MLISSFGIALYGGYQFADGSFWSLFLLLPFFIVVNNKEAFKKIELILVATSIWIVLFSSPQFILAYVILFSYYFFSNKKNGLNYESFKTLIIYISVPTIFLLSFLIFTNSFIPFYTSTFKFNNKEFFDHLYTHKITGISVLDLYLHTSYDVINHVKERITGEGKYLVILLQSLKSQILKLDTTTENYKLIFSNFYSNFFTFEVLILMFYFFGFVSLLLNKKKTLTVLCLLFILGIRLRINERIHMAPFYLFSFWMIATAIASSANNVYLKRKLNLHFLIFLAASITIFIFVQKNWFEFEQIAFNYFPDDTQNTIFTIENSTKAEDKILVFAQNSARYYYESERLPSGYFVNYFPWYEQSNELKTTWFNDIKNYKGSFLIVDQNLWKSYCTKKDQNSWEMLTLNQIYFEYENNSTYANQGRVLKRITKENELLNFCS